MNRRETFVIDNDQWPRSQTEESCRLILETLRPYVCEFETDIPITGDDWPEAAASAALILRSVAERTGSVEKSGYARTGVVSVAEDAVWSAFMIFAPWAYDARVIDKSGHHLLTLSDEGESVTADLDVAQQNAIATILPPDALVPESSWHQKSSRRQDS